MISHLQPYGQGIYSSTHVNHCASLGSRTVDKRLSPCPVLFITDEKLNLYTVSWQTLGSKFSVLFSIPHGFGGPWLNVSGMVLFAFSLLFPLPTRWSTLFHQWEVVCPWGSLTHFSGSRENHIQFLKSNLGLHY